MYYQLPTHLLRNDTAVLILVQISDEIAPTLNAVPIGSRNPFLGMCRLTCEERQLQMEIVCRRQKPIQPLTSSLIQSHYLIARKKERNNRAKIDCRSQRWLASTSGTAHDPVLLRLEILSSPNCSPRVAGRILHVPTEPNPVFAMQ